MESLASPGRFGYFENCGFRIGTAISAYRFAAQNFCEAPIHYEDFTKWSDHNVGGFEVAVKDAARVGKSDGFARNTQEEAEAVLHGLDALDRIGGGSWLSTKLHGVEDTAVGERADVVDGDDSRMFKSRERTRASRIRRLAKSPSVPGTSRTLSAMRRSV